MEEILLSTVERKNNKIYKTSAQAINNRPLILRTLTARIENLSELKLSSFWFTYNKLLFHVNDL